jgi:hypothetical protein
MKVRSMVTLGEMRTGGGFLEWSVIVLLIWVVVTKVSCHIIMH